MRTVNLFRQLPVTLVSFVFILVVALGTPDSAHAQQGLFAGNTAQAQASSLSAIDKFLRYVRTQQFQLNRKLAKSVRDLKAKSSMSAAYTLILASLLYGFFHAAGPGHGKAVISGYLLASRQTIRRGIVLAFVASFLQAISAIIIVMIFVVLWKATGAKISEGIGSITRFSYGLIVLAGIGILWTTLRTSHPVCGHEHHSKEICTTCGHAHMPSPDQLDKAPSLKTMAAIVFAVGVRPCTGAVLMLILALTHGIFTAGLVATFAMSLGTAVTVSILAALTVGAKQGLLQLFSGHSKAANLITKSLGILAGIFIVIIGLTLFFSATPRPFI